MALPAPPAEPSSEAPLPETLGARLWAALSGGIGATRRARRLRLCESLSLGEKRLLALVECDGQRLLLGVTTEIALLQQLGPAAQPAPEGTPPGEVSR